VTLRVVDAGKVTNRTAIDQGIISTTQLERPVDEELSADRETAVDETADHSWRSRSFLSSPRDRSQHIGRFFRRRRCDVMNSSFSVRLAGRRFYCTVGCQDAAIVILFAVVPPVVGRSTTLTKFATRRTLAAG
jgi:hypothetical protein